MPEGTKAMPSDLVNSDYETKWFRADESTEGQAKKWFANESGADFTEIRVAKVYMRDPGPTCECEDEATCGLRYTFKHRDSGIERATDEVMCCADCQRAVLSDPGGAVLKVEPIPLEKAIPFDGWPMVGCSADAPGATAYWERTDDGIN